MESDDNLHTYFARAEQAFASGDMRATGSLIKQVLLRDFTHKPAWRILHALYGADQAIEVFQYKFTRKNYPDKLHLLTTIPDWISEVEPELSGADHHTEPELSSQPATISKSTQIIKYLRLLPSAIFQYKAVFPLILLLLFMPAICILAGTWSVKSRAITPTALTTVSQATNVPQSDPGENTSSETVSSATLSTTSETPPAEHQEPTPQAPDQTALPDPLEFTHTYYNAINTHDYATAWASLSSNFIEKMSARVGHPYTYTNDYAAYWDTVASLEIIESSTEKSDTHSAVLLLKMRRNMTSGETPIFYQRIHLVSAESSSTWLIDATETWK